MTATTTETPNFKELKEKYAEDNILEIENLLKIVKRYNSELMEECSNQTEIAKNENNARELERIRGIYQNFADETQNKTYELFAVLDIIFEKLKPFFEVEGEFYVIEDYIKQIRPEIY